jgi:hypothetical protein
MYLYVYLYFVYEYLNRECRKLWQEAQNDLRERVIDGVVKLERKKVEKRNGDNEEKEGMNTLISIYMNRYRNLCTNIYMNIYLYCMKIYIYI